MDCRVFVLYPIVVKVVIFESCHYNSARGRGFL